MRFGVCADLHADVMHDAARRVDAFLRCASREGVDFVVQLGDFCRPYERNRPVVDAWNSFDRPAYHVLGNHDTDGGFTREEVCRFWSMPQRYYSFDHGGWHFVVLDGNDPSDDGGSGYSRHIAREQLDWLDHDLEQSVLPTVIFSHQCLADLEAPEEALDNAARLRAICEGRSRQVSGATGKPHATGPPAAVVACFSGHNHVDDHRVVSGIHYVQINSMSYYWLGNDYRQIRYDEQIDRDYPWIACTAPYREPLFAVVTLEPDTSVRLTGTETSFVGPPPWKLGYPHHHMAGHVVPRIRDRTLRAT